MRPIYQVYVEEQLIDIDPKTVIALTLQAADFASGDLVNRKASFTNQIKAPATPTNIRIFEYANNPKSGSTFPYIKKTVKILCNGIQILEGIVIIKSFDTYFNLQIYSLSKDLSYRIANLYLSDLDFGDSPITWDDAFIESVRSSTTGLCAPLVDYGQIDRALTDIEIGTYYLPSVSYKDILTAIVENAGYTISGDFYDNDPTFNAMVMLYSKSTFPGTTFVTADIMPDDILQSDFLSDFLVKFGAYFRVTNNDLQIITLESILTDTTVSVDWTNKRNKNKKDIVQYTLNGLAKKNKFSYPDVDNLPDGFWYVITSIFPFDRTNGYLTVSNELLNDRAELFTSLFNQSNWVYNATGAVSKIPRIDETRLSNSKFSLCATSSIWDATSGLPTSFDLPIPPKPMLAILTDKATTENQVKYNGTLYSDHKVARFNPTAAITLTTRATLAWGNSFRPSDELLTLYYASLQRLFTSGIIITTHEYLLTDLDINSLDLLTPIFDDGNYYLINKVNNYVSGRTTRVELLKI